MDYKRIAVIIITYNQESVIRRALDSVFSQLQWGLSQVIVGDDCSTDKTWDILLEYKERFPEIMCPIHNEENLGIYANAEKLISLKAPSDLYFMLAGDDELCDHYLENLQAFIANKNINTNEAVGIISDWKTVYPNGKESVFKQDLVTKNHDLTSLLMRLKIYNRSLVVSQKVVDRYAPIVLDKGLRLAEMMFEVRSFLHIDNMYYMPMVATTYYAGIGVSTKLSVGKSDYYTLQSSVLWEYFKTNISKSIRDKYYCDYELMKASYLDSPTYSKYIKMLYYFFRGLLPGNNDSFIRITYHFVKLLKYKYSKL